MVVPVSLEDSELEEMYGLPDERPHPQEDPPTGP